MNTYDFFNYPREIYIADKIYCDAGWKWNSDDNTWVGFLLWFVFSGGADVITGEEQYKLKEGDYFLFDLTINHICTHNPQNPLCVYMFYFGINDNGLLSQKIKINQIKKLYSGDFLFNTMLCERVLSGMLNSKYQNIWFDSILTQIFCFEEDIKKTPPQVYYIYKQILFFPEDEYTLEEMSEQSGYSKSQLIRLFKKYMDVTPYEHVVNSRINKAKSLLLFSTRSISDIAGLLHYSDINHFSKQFYKKTGMYPTKFRTMNSNKQKNKE